MLERFLDVAKSFTAIKPALYGFPIHWWGSQQFFLALTDEYALQFEWVHNRYNIHYSSHKLQKVVARPDSIIRKVFAIGRNFRSIVCWPVKRLSASDYVFKCLDIDDIINSRNSSEIEGELVPPCSESFDGILSSAVSNTAQTHIICSSTDGKLFCLDMRPEKWILTWENQMKDHIESIAASTRFVAVSTASDDPKYVFLHTYELETGKFIAHSKRHRSNLSRVFCISEDRFLLLLRNRMHLYDALSCELIVSQELPSTAHHGYFRVLFRYNVLFIADQMLMETENYLSTLWHIRKNEIIKLNENVISMRHIEHLDHFTENMDFHVVLSSYSQTTGSSHNVARFRFESPSSPSLSSPTSENDKYDAVKTNTRSNSEKCILS